MKVYILKYLQPDRWDKILPTLIATAINFLQMRMYKK